MLVYVDNGIGSAMVLNNEFYRGLNGYAGEIGLARVVVDGQENYLDEFVTLRTIKNHVGALLNKKVKTKEVVELYKTNNEIRNYINNSASILGKKLKDIVELLNISRIVIQGRVIDFGEEYLSLIKEEINKSQNQCDVVYSSLRDDSIFIGAMSEAVDKLIDIMTLKSVKGGY